MRRLLSTVIALLLVASTLRAEVESGPKAGDKLAELKVRAVVGSIEDKDVDYTKERGDAPTAYLFVNAEKFSRPMNKFIKTLDGQLGDLGDTARAVAIWVGGDADKNKEYLPKIQKSVSYEKTALAVFGGDANGPNGWGINSAAHLTVVIVVKGKVVKSFAYESVNDTDVKDVVATWKKALEKK